MFTPEIAKKAKFTLDSDVERELQMLFDDLITQKTSKMKANMSDLELRITAVEIELLNKLKTYKNLLEDSIKRYGNSYNG